MPFQINDLDELATTGANIALDANQYDREALARALRNLQGRGSGSITVRNAHLLATNDLRAIATALGNRVTFED